VLRERCLADSGRSVECHDIDFPGVPEEKRVERVEQVVAACEV
jgi:hypothetical protein